MNPGKHFFFNKSEYFSKSILPISIQEQTTDIYEIGKFEQLDGLIQPLPVFVVELPQDSILNERNGKKYQFDIARKILRQQSFHNGLFIFTKQDPADGFRISLVYSNYQDTKRTYNYYKRNTFYVAPHITNKTFEKQFLNGNFDTFQAIKDCFFA